MADQAKPKTKPSRMIYIVLIFVALFCGYLLFQSGILGGGNSCSSLRSGYESAKEVEDYGKVSEYYQKMNDLGCK
jgi:hypothetical protein